MMVPVKHHDMPFDYTMRTLEAVKEKEHKLTSETSFNNELLTQDNNDNRIEQEYHKNISDKLSSTSTCIDPLINVSNSSPYTINMSEYKRNELKYQLQNLNYESRVNIQSKYDTQDMIIPLDSKLNKTVASLTQLDVNKSSRESNQSIFDNILYSIPIQAYNDIRYQSSNNSINDHSNPIYSQYKTTQIDISESSSTFVNRVSPKKYSQIKYLPSKDESNCSINSKLKSSIAINQIEDMNKEINPNKSTSIKQTCKINFFRPFITHMNDYEDNKIEINVKGGANIDDTCILDDPDNVQKLNIFNTDKKHFPLYSNKSENISCDMLTKNNNNTTTINTIIRSPSYSTKSSGYGSTSSCPSSPENNSSILYKDTNTTVNYTYESFFISDGRSKRKSHLKTKKPIGLRYKCTECGKHYATSSNLSRHKQTHRSLDSESAKQCPDCGKIYVSMPAMSMHLLTHQLKHICKICNKAFSRPWLLQGHMRSHSGERPYGCAHCLRAFADRSNLRAHMQTHSNSNKLIQ